MRIRLPQNKDAAFVDLPHLKQRLQGHDAPCLQADLLIRTIKVGGSRKAKEIKLERKRKSRMFKHNSALPFATWLSNAAIRRTLPSLLDEEKGWSNRWTAPSVD